MLILVDVYPKSVYVVLAGDDDEAFGRIHDAVVRDVGDLPRALQGLLVLKPKNRDSLSRNSMVGVFRYEQFHSSVNFYGYNLCCVFVKYPTHEDSSQT